MFAKKPENFSIYIDDWELEQVSFFEYLGTILDQDYISKKEMCSQIEQDKAAFIKMNKIFT